MLSICFEHMHHMQPFPQMQNLRDPQLAMLLQALGQQPPPPQHVAYPSVGQNQGNMLEALIAGLLNQVCWKIYALFFLSTLCTPHH